VEFLKHHEKGNHNYLKGQHHGHKYNDKYPVPAFPLDPAETVSGKCTGNNRTNNVAGNNKKGIPQIQKERKGKNGPQVITPLKIFGEPHYRCCKKFSACFKGTNHEPVKRNSVNQYQDYQYGIQYKEFNIVFYAFLK
jgi:hypothetical protein